MKSLRRELLLLVILLFASPAWADADAETDAETNAESAETGDEYEHVWSATFISDFKFITDRHADNGAGAFFDQYEFTPNKSSSLPVELGIRELSFDRFGPGQTPQLQLRFQSPTSNLGISGSQIDKPFFNQHADLFGRLVGIELDVAYWRFRTEDLRLFPNTQGRQFEDLTSSGDRFARERTGLFADLRMRPAEIASGRDATDWLAPEFSLRGGYEDRDGSQQLGFIQDQSNRWGQLKEPMDQEVTKAGGGILVAPGGLFTLTADFDYDRFRQKSSTITDDDLGSGFLPGDDSLGFVPDTDRFTGTVLLQSRIGERAVLEAGFQASRLTQVHSFTPTQRTADLDDNELIYYSANAAADVDVTDSISLNAFVKYDQRTNKIERDTSLFNPYDNDVQFDPYLKRWNRVYAGVEGVYALHRRNHVAVGARYEWIDRDLDFGQPTNRIILKPNARIADRTQMWTVYGRANLRPFKGLGLNGEIGYRDAPDTGYLLDLDNYVYGKLRASYRIPIEQTVLLSAFVNGGSGKNKDFSVTAGSGASPAGNEMNVKFERKDIAWGATVTSYPLDDVSVFASFFQSYDKQDYRLILSNLQRYWQTIVPIAFSDDGSPDTENKQLSFVLGTHVRFSDETDGGLSYSFTRAKLDYDSNGETANVRQISDNRSIDADIHGLQLEVGHWLREGLRIEAGYRLQLFDDSSRRPSGTGSVVRSRDPSETQQTVTLGITLTSDLTIKSE